MPVSADCQYGPCAINHRKVKEHTRTDYLTVLKDFTQRVIVYDDSEDEEEQGETDLVEAQAKTQIYHTTGG